MGQSISCCDYCKMCCCFFCYLYTIGEALKYYRVGHHNDEETPILGNNRTNDVKVIHYYKNNNNNTKINYTTNLLTNQSNIIDSNLDTNVDNNDEIEQLIGKKKMALGSEIILKIEKLNGFYRNDNEIDNFLKLKQFYLNEDIVILILSYLPYKNILKISILNKSFNKYFTCHPLLLKNYIIKNKYYCNEINDTQDFKNLIIKPDILLNNFFTKTKPHELQRPIIGIVGEINIGKTTFIKRVIENKYSNNMSTALCEIQSLCLQHKNLVDVCFNIFDFSGDSKFFSIEKILLRNLKGIMFCFDLSNEASFFTMESMLQDFILENIENAKNCIFLNLNQKIKRVICIVGLKSDCKRSDSLDKKVNNLLRKLISDEILFKDLFIQYFEVSSKENINVNEPFYFMAYKFLKSAKYLEID
ncbi:hypothetical protein ABK040_013461 [Willaertia magna]